MNLAKLPLHFCLIFCSLLCAGQSTDAFIVKAEKAIQKGDFKHAISYSSKALELDPNNLKALEIQYDSYFSLKKYNETVQNLDKAKYLSLVSKSISYYFKSCGNYYFDRDSIPFAVDCFASALELNPLLELFSNSIGSFNNQLNISKLKTLKNSLPLSDSTLNSSKFLLLRSQIYYQLHDFDSAFFDLEYAQSSTDLNQINFQPRWILLGHALLEQGQYQYAFNCFTIANQISPSADLLSMLANIKFTEHDFNSAIHYLNQIILLDPTNIGAFFNRATCYLEMGSLANAVVDFEYVLSKKETDEL